MQSAFDLIIDIQEETPLALPKPDYHRFVKEALECCLAEANIPHPARVELSMLIAPKGRMAAINKTWLKRQGPTDVLSFPQEGPGIVLEQLGDIVICPGVAREEARRRHRGFRQEIERLTVHGILHLLGFDHETDDGTMRRMERRILSQLRSRPVAR